MPRLECLSLIEQLKLSTMYKHFDEVVTEGIRRKRSTLDILHRLLTIEQTERNIRSIEYRVNQAKFPQHKSLADFDFKNTPLNKPAITLFMDNDFIENKRNIIFVGGPGTGKTHLATAIGINAATMGKKVRFWNVLDLVNKLELDKETKQYKLSNQLIKHDLIILDELGYLPFSQKGGALLFHLISQLHEHVSIIMTTALLDRLVHHCDIIETGNESYRFKKRT